MFDPRDDARDRAGREDGRARVYDERDRDDPREGLMRDLDLPRGEDRELVALRDRVYELDGEDSRTLAAVGALRVVPEATVAGLQGPQKLPSNRPSLYSHSTRAATSETRTCHGPTTLRRSRSTSAQALERSPQSAIRTARVNAGNGYGVSAACELIK